MMVTAGMPKCPLDRKTELGGERKRERARGRHRELAAAICMRRCTRGCSVFPHTHSVNSVQSTSVDRSGCIKIKPFSGRGQLFLLRSCVNRMSVSSLSSCHGTVCARHSSRGARIAPLWWTVSCCMMCPRLRTASLWGREVHKTPPLLLIVMTSVRVSTGALLRHSRTSTPPRTGSESKYLSF